MSGADQLPIPFAWVCRDIGRIPVLQAAALQIGRLIVRAHDGFRCMTRAAITERIDKDGARNPTTNAFETAGISEVTSMSAA